MRRPLLAASLACAVSLALPSAHAIPPAAGGVLASDNIDLVATIPDALGIGAKIVGDHMYITTLHGLSIYDISMGLPVLTGHLPMPHWENESVDTDGEIAIISADWFVAGGTGTNILVIVDVSNVNAPVIKSITTQDDGHTATCVKSCDFVWTSGGEIYDLRGGELVTKYAGWLGGGYTHNWNVDKTGYAWGNGGLIYNTQGTNGATQPQKLQSSGGFGWHNSIRPNASNGSLGDSTLDKGELLISAGEDIWEFFGPALNCEGDDQVETSWFRRTAPGVYNVKFLDSWNVGSDGTLPEAKPTAATFCSSHWLDYSKGLVAVGWYEQGTRILDVSNPSNIRQVGYFMPVETQTWAAYFNEVSESPLGAGTYVYTLDLVRGMDVFKINATAGASPTVLAPHLNPSSPALQPSDDWGWACRIPGGASIAG